MKKNIRFMSLILVLTLVISVFGSTVSFAADTQATEITFSDDFDTLETVQLNSMYYFVAEVNKPELTLTAASSDDSIIHIEREKLSENPGTFYFDLAACKNGEATVTFTASDGATVSRKLIVEGTGEPSYTISSDTNDDFSLAKGSSSFIKIHFENNDMDTFTSPTLSPSNDKILKITMVNFDEENDDYYYRVDAVGSLGQTDDLYMGAYGFIPKKLCTVSIAANKDLRLDTDCEYTCNIGETYRFVAYTGSATAPVVSTNNSVISTTYIGKVSGGYEYRMEALESGNSLVMVQLNGEKASFPVSVNQEDEFPEVTSDTSSKVTLAQGASYTYKLTIMGGGEPRVVAGTGGVLSVQMVKKDGINYYYKVTATGKPSDQAGLYVIFPNGRYDDYSVNIGSVSIKESSSVIAPKSDTNTNFTLKQGASYTFKITGASSFYAGTSSVFKTEQVKRYGNDVYYKITAIGKPGQSTGFYMAAAGQPVQKVCVVTVGAAAATTVLKSDTNVDFSIKQKASYQFKITAPGIKSINFNTGTAGVFGITFVRHTGDDFIYKITAIGKPGQETGIYASVPGQTAKKLCKVSIAQG